MSQAGKIETPRLEIDPIAKKRMDGLGAPQSGFLANIQEANRSWLGFMESEASLASELTTKLAAARSIPETATAWQEWATRRMQLNAENASHLAADGRKLMETGARLFSSGGFSNGRASIT